MAVLPLPDSAKKRRKANTWPVPLSIHFTVGVILCHFSDQSGKRITFLELIFAFLINIAKVHRHSSCVSFSFLERGCNVWSSQQPSIIYEGMNLMTKGGITSEWKQMVIKVILQKWNKKLKTQFEFGALIVITKQVNQNYRLPSSGPSVWRDKFTDLFQLYCNFGQLKS